jgi:hypothetical protein
MLIVSSNRPHFTRSDVAERLLPLYFARPKKFSTENRILRELALRRGAIMGDLLERLGLIADGIGLIDPKLVPFRMAEFGSFVLRAAEAAGHEETKRWSGLLKQLKLAQADFAGEADGVISALRILLERNGEVRGSVGSLFKQCTEIARAEHLGLPKTVQGFGQRLTNLRSAIELELNVSFSDERLHANHRYITMIPVVQKPWSRLHGA